MNQTKLIQDNFEVHDKIYKEYDKRHTEIFNYIEQLSLQQSLNQAFELIQTESLEKLVLDFGCGTGNLTNHLLQLGVKVTGANVSKNFNTTFFSLSRKKKFQSVQLNGSDLSNFLDNTFDMVATYSVLHHIPDYLAAVQEFIRVTKPGGIIYFDHEVNEEYWKKSEVYNEFLRKVVTKRDWSKYLKLSNYYTKLVQLFNPRYQFEVDIHVFEDDHIEWEAIQKLLINHQRQVLYKKDYLLFKKNYDLHIYDTFKDTCTDMAVLVARKG